MAPSYFVRIYVEPHADFLASHTLNSQVILGLAETDYDAGQSSHSRIATVLFGLFILLGTPVWLLLAIPMMFEWAVKSLRPNRAPSDLLFPRIARTLKTWARFIVYVPSTKLYCVGGIMGILIPSSTPFFMEKQDEYRRDNEATLDSILEEKELVRDVLNAARVQRIETLKQAKAKLSPGMNPPLSHDAAHDLLKKCEESIKMSLLLKDHLEALQEDHLRLQDLVETQVTADQTKFRGLADWAKNTWEAYEHIATALATVSFFGAGLTYTTIFSATRGDIGLMCYMFAFFAVGFVVPVVSQTLLKWGSNVPKQIPFTTPRLWRLVFATAIYFAVFCVTAAVTILNVTIYQLVWPDYPKNGNPYQDQAVYDHSPRPSAMISFVLLCLGVTVVLVAVLLYIVANGARALNRGLFGRPSAAASDNPANYVRV